MATRDSKDKDGVKKDDRAGGGARAGFDGYMTEDQCRAELEQKIEETRRLEESRRRKKEEEDRKMEEQRKRDDEHRRTDRSRDDDHRRKRSKSPVRSRSNSQRRSRDREAHGRSRSPISRARSPRRGKSRSPKRTDSPRRSRSPRRRSRTPPRREQRSPSASRLTEFEILKSNHPKFVNSRVFIGRLDQERIMREDLVELFGRYGRLLGVSIFKGFGFVQFGNEQDANAAIAAENHSLLKGCNLDLRIASEGRKKVRVPIPGDDPKSWDPKYRREYGARGQEPPLPPRMPPAPPPSMVAQVDRPPIECQFALHTNESTVREYADQIDTRLAPIGIRSHKLEFESDADLRGILEKAARHKVPYAIVLRSQNQVHSSLTLNVLYGTAQEHRNMPLEDALSFIKKNFELYIQELREKSRSHPAPQPVLRVPPPPPRPLAGPPPPMAAPTPEYLPPPRHVHYLLNLIADSRILTLEEVDSLLDYLEAQRRLIVKYRGGPPRRAPPETNDRLSKEKDSGAADPPPEIQAKILNILNGGQEGSQQQQPQQQQFHQPTMVEPPSTTQSAANLNLNFQDPSVKQALDNLMQSGPSLLQNIGTAPAAVPQGNGFGQEEKLAQMHQQFQMHQQQVQFQQQQQQQQQMQMQTQQAMQMQGGVPFGGQPPTGYGITPTPSYRF